MDFRIREMERKAYAEDGFFVREAVFEASEIERLRAAAERAAVRAAEAAAQAAESEAYSIDGNRYVEAARSTIQLEHGSASSTIRVVEPFHHLDPELDRLLGDPRIIDPVCGVLGETR